MDTDRPVLVIGASGIDIKGRSLEPLQMGHLHGGIVRSTVGGVARNISENLARLEVPTVLLSAVGRTRMGTCCWPAQAAGVDTRYVLRVPDRQTGSYLALVDESGHTAISLSDYGITSAISPSYLQRHRALFAEDVAARHRRRSVQQNAGVRVQLAKRYSLPVCVDPTSRALAAKLVKYLPEIYMASPDAQEAARLRRRVRGAAHQRRSDRGGAAAGQRRVADRDRDAG